MNSRVSGQCLYTIYISDYNNPNTNNNDLILSLGWRIAHGLIKMANNPWTH